jgi:hypothetical protein
MGFFRKVLALIVLLPWLALALLAATVLSPIILIVLFWVVSEWAQKELFGEQ